MGILSKIKKYWDKEHGKLACGVGFFRLSRKHLFTPACRLHDIHYLQKERRIHNYPREYVDALFYHNMIMLIKRKKIKGIKALYYEQLAKLFYAIVKKYGAAYY